MRMIRHSISLFALFVLAACGGGGAVVTSPDALESLRPEGPSRTQAAPATAAAGDPTPGTALSACEVVAPADIEKALGLAAGSVEPGTLKQNPTVLDKAAQECRYDSEWGGLVVLLTPTDGINTYDAVEKAFGDDAEAIPGIGDGALWFEKNDRGYFLKGSVLTLLQFTHITDTDLASFRDPTVALGTAAAAKI